MNLNLQAKVRAYFTEGNKRSIIAKKNIVITFLLKGFSILIGFILIPVTINYVNPTQYGIWLTLSSIISWFSYFDIGLANGLKNKLAETNALNKLDISKTYVSTTYAILAIISSVIFIFFWGINHFLDWGIILHTSDRFNNLKDAALLLIGIFCTQFVVQIINTVLTACHEVAKVSLIVLLGQIFSLVVLYIFTNITSGSLIKLIAIIAGVPLLVQLFLSIYYYKTKYAAFSPNFSFVNFKYARNLLILGGSFFFIQIGSLILFQTDNIIIAQLFHPQEVTVFNIAFKLFSAITMVFTIIMTPFWTAFTDAYVRNEMHWIKKVIRKMRLFWIILCVCSILLFTISPILYKVWLHGRVQVPMALSFVMSIYVMGYSWIMLHCYLLNGIGKIKLQVYMYLVSILINIPMAIFFGKQFGIAGVTFSNSLIFVVMGILLWIQCNKILKGNAYGVWNR
ncbi:MAG: hypothetical protein JWP44_1493 [Mucilaginibacter sp.]|nr:hypothetical protein [Mucilaginibacter sp.]